MTMSATCDRCGELLEVSGHENLDDDTKPTVEIQSCISCSFVTRVRL